MKKIVSKSLVLLMSSILAVSAFADGSKNYVKQEINASDRCLPTFYENLKSRWTFKMGWTDGCDAAKWKAEGLAKARELIIQEEDNTPFDMVILESEKRGKYTANKVVFNISQDSRVMAYLLVPNGKKGQTYPAALMLHDHGSNFVIGKEKMVKAFSKDKAVAETLKIKDGKQYREALKALPPETK